MGQCELVARNPPSWSTTKRILTAYNLKPDPKSDRWNWENFLRTHPETLWQADFFSRLPWTLEGLKQCFILVFLHFGSRWTFVSPDCLTPNSAWIRTQADAFVTRLGPEQASKTLVTCGTF